MSCEHAALTVDLRLFPDRAPEGVVICRDCMARFQVANVVPVVGGSIHLALSPRAVQPTFYADPAVDV